MLRKSGVKFNTHNFKRFVSCDFHKMNVLVYSGPGTTPDSVKHTLESLRRFLSPYYAVVNVDSRLLKKEPWAAKTSLIVIPGGADTPICRELNGEGNNAIKDFVRKGGKYLGFCAGGYYASSRCEFEVGDPSLEVSGSRELKFFPGVARGGAFKGFQYGSESGARITKLETSEGESYNYYNGGAVFVDADKYDNVEILASYTEPLNVDPGSSSAAIVYSKVGNGAAILTGTHPEFVPELIDEEELSKALAEHNQSRQKLLRSLLIKLGLKVNDNELVRPRLTPLLLSSPIPGRVSNLISEVISDIGIDEENIIKGTNDRFRLTEEENTHQIDKQEEFEDPDTAIKELHVYKDSLPNRKLTPFFDINQYFRILQESHGSISNDIAGSVLLYGEVVTSTSTLLDKNYNILSHLPSGLVAAATVQVSGRGRGGNIWINPPGVVASSLVLELPISYKHAPVVFVQYLTSLAVVEAVKSLGNGYEELPIKIKWPNDIYALKPEYFGKQINNTDEAYAKIAGILVNTNVIGNSYKVVIGTGINLFNAAPTTSINSTINEFNKQRSDKPPLETLSPETLLGKYMYHIGILYKKFKESGFRPLLPLYYKHWLHTNQIVHLKDHSNARARLIGITDDYGLLVAQEIDRYDNPTGQLYNLQPDGNSFDMFKGLISKRTTSN